MQAPQLTSKSCIRLTPVCARSGVRLFKAGTTKHNFSGGFFRRFEVCDSPLRRSLAARYKAGDSKDAEEEPISDDYDMTGAISGEWSATWSLASYEDVMEHFNRSVLEESISPDTPLSKVMQTKVMTCNPEDPLADVADILETQRISGMPVIAPDIGIVVGVVSRKDISQTLGALVEDVMSSPPVATKKETTVQEAACIMLKYKVHRLPVVDDRARCIGIVTRSDIFAALGLSAVDLGAGNATVDTPIKKSTRLV